MKPLVSIVLALFLITIGTSTEASGNEDEYTIAAFTADVQKRIMVWTTTEIREQIMTNKKRNAAIDIDQIQLNKDFASSGFNSLLGVSSLTEAEAKCGQNQTTSQSSGVSNADVLRSICALIASLSKQSYALKQSKERTLAELTVLENELPKRIEAEDKAKLEAEAKAKLEAEAKAAKKAKKKITILCKKNKTTKKVSGVSPKCPNGYKKVS
jgi:hypothetical protein